MMECESAESIVGELESLTSEINNYLLKADSTGVVERVVRQCRCLQRLAQYTIDSSLQERLKAVHESVIQQQLLIEQALKIAEEFNKAYVRMSSYAEFA
ncbi:hypothetical protein FY534_02225 [Alicyclobacillus sp. TC]|uniref:hypothetical protein n=1 Tax=Alicyclobacillus sp. TC TaxID=2606450 RepID=UPI00193304DC|nr:hypothetical protein [Alicyclobacillus sp. TC]QRF22632.1 hypothetical protein FY534_02225 [Alicyclobacillus sp. TC]